jgi:hypothetical protein
LWLKIFSVKPKSSGSELAECGGAMISKIPKVCWPEVVFVETIKVWQRELFYITDLLVEGQIEVPAFMARPPKRLVSWMKKGLDWGNPDELKMLQRRLKAVIDKNIKLVDVIHVMLHHHVLPLQLRANLMWCYKPEDEPTVQNFFRVDLDGMWMTLFKLSKNTFPEEEGDVGLLGNVAWKTKKILRTRKIYPWRCIATTGESMSTYPRRPLSGSVLSTRLM